MVDFLKKNWYWAIPALLAVGAGAYLWLQKRRAENARTDGAQAAVNAGKTPGTPPSKTPTPKTPAPPKDRFPGLDSKALLYVGVKDKEKEVRYLQNWLMGYSPFTVLTANGVFDTTTGAALQQATGKTSIRLLDLPA